MDWAGEVSEWLAVWRVAIGLLAFLLADCSCVRHRGDFCSGGWKTDCRAPSLEIACTVLRNRKNSRGLWGCFLGRLIHSSVAVLFNILSL